MGVRLAQRLSSDALSLVFNGFSVVLIPTHLLVQRWKQNSAAEFDPVCTATTGTVPPEAMRAVPEGSSVLPSLTWAHAQHAIFGSGLGVLSALMGVGGLPLAVSYLTVFTACPHHLVQVTLAR